MVSIKQKPPLYPLGVKAVEEVPTKTWELDDRFGHTCASPIVIDGLDTKYDMVYKHVLDPNARRFVWTPCGSVGRDWTPVHTAPMVDRITAQLKDKNILKSISAKVAPMSKKSTTHRVDFVIDKPIEMPYGPRDAGTDFVDDPQSTQKTEVYYPRLVLWNGYSGCCGLRGAFGLWRKICSNGLEIPFLTGKIYNLHTSRKSVDGFINRFMSQSWDTACNRLETLLKSTRETKLSEEMMNRILPQFTQADEQSWKGYPDHTTSGLINFLSFQQTHNASINSESRYQSILNKVVKDAGFKEVA